MDNLKKNYKHEYIAFSEVGSINIPRVNIPHIIISNYTKKIYCYCFLSHVKKRNIVVPNGVKCVSGGIITNNYIFETTNNLKSYETHKNVKIFTDCFLKHNTHKTKNKYCSILNVIFQHSLFLGIVKRLANIFLFENIHSFVTYTNTDIICHHKNIIIFKNAKKIMLNILHKSVKNLTVCRNIYYLFVCIKCNTNVNVNMYELCNVFLINICYCNKQMNIPKLTMIQHTLKLFFTSNTENNLKYNFTYITKINIVNIHSLTKILTTKTLNTIGTVRILHVNNCSNNILNKCKYADYIVTDR